MVLRRKCFRPHYLLLAAVAVAGRDLNDGWDSASFCHFQRAQTIARPAVKEIVATGCQVPGSDPVEIFLLRAVIVRPIKEREQPHWMPPQGMDQRRRDFLLPVIIGNCLAEKASTIRRTQRFKRIRVQPGTADASKDRIEQMPR